MATIQLFNKPVYTKCSKADGSTIPGYIFNVTNSIDAISFNADEGQTDSDTLSKCLEENKSWWQTTLIGFLSIANNYFTKKYTADIIAKHINHSGIDNTKYSNNTLVVFTPKYILISDNKFTMMWDVKKEDRIEVPDLEEHEMELTLSGNAKEGLIANNQTSTVHVPSGLEEADTDNLQQAEPIQFLTSKANGGAGISPTNIGSIKPAIAGGIQNRYDSRHDDKRKIDEARVRAKIAHYKAEKAISRYLEKYGDSDLSDSDEESSDSESYSS
jgi:hypothetical protein